MSIFKTKLWSPFDIALLKGAVFFLGMVVGAYLSLFVKQFIWIFVIVTIILSLRPFYYYWFKE